MTEDEARAALADHQADHDNLWACMRALRCLAMVGHTGEAHAVATTFAEAQGADAAAGEALLSSVLQARVRRLAVGEALVHEGAQDDTVYVLLTGKARVRRIGVGELAHLPPGAVIGEVALVTGSLRTATVVAETSVSVLVFEARQLAELCRRLPAVYVRLRETGRARMVAQLMGPASIFGTLDATARAALFEQCLPISLPRGTPVIVAGEPGRAMCILASGFCEVWRAGDDDAEEVLARLGPGEVFGELSLLLDRVASAHVRTTTVVTLFALDRQRFAETLDRFPGARARITALAEARLGVRQGDGEPAMPVVRVHRRPTGETPLVLAPTPIPQGRR